jgi:hypothetical protein
LGAIGLAIQLLFAFMFLIPQRILQLELDLHVVLTGDIIVIVSPAAKAGIGRKVDKRSSTPPKNCQREFVEPFHDEEMCQT